MRTRNAGIFGHIYLTFLSQLIRKKLDIRLRGLWIAETTFLGHFENIMLSPVEINTEREYVATTPDKRQATYSGHAHKK